MAYSLTVNGYEFDNPPEDYMKRIRLGNTEVPHFRRRLAKYYQSDSQELTFQVEGRLSLNETTDLDELAQIQTLAQKGDTVPVKFDPFFSGEAVIEDDPFRQANQRGTYRFTFNVNSEDTNNSAYPAHATPTTGNVFKLGDFDFGYDPESVEENYNRQTSTVDRLSGVSQTTDSAGLVTEVQIDGNTDGRGQAALWKRARRNILSFLEAEFQKGWALITRLEIRNNTDAPDYLEGLFEYSIDFFIVSDPVDGIGDVSSYVDYDVEQGGTYVSDAESGSEKYANNSLEFIVRDGTGAINDNYVSWGGEKLTLDDNATNYVYVEDPNSDGQGSVNYNTTGFTASQLPLYIVETSNGAIVSVRDVRDVLVGDNDADAGDSRTDDTIDLYHTVESGISPDAPNNQRTTWDRTSYQLTASATNYFYVEDPNSDGDGQVSVNTSGYPANTVPLWRIETDQTTIINRIDDRPSDLTTDGSGDTGDSDLLFEDRFVLDDRGVTFDRSVSRTDTLAISGAVDFDGSTNLSTTATLSDSFNARLFQEIDQLEHNNLTNFYSGDTGDFDTPQSGAIQGVYSLAYTSGTSAKSIQSDSGDGLPHYPAKGDIFTVILTDAGSAPDQVIPIGGPINTSENGYGIRMDQPSGNVSLIRFDTGSQTTLASDTPSMVTGDAYEFEVEWHDGTGSEPDDTLVVTMYEVHQGDLSRESQITQFSAQDSTHASVSAWGWTANGNTNTQTIMADFAAILGSV